MNYLSESNPQEVFSTAIETMAKAVLPTFGRKAEDIAVQAADKRIGYVIINDGYKILEFLSHKDSEIASAMETAKQFIKTTAQVAGDGTTSTTILSKCLLNRYKEKTIDSLKSDKEKIVEVLPQVKVEVSEEELIKSVAEVSAKKRDLVDAVVEAFSKSKAVSYQYSQQQGVSLDVTEGVILDKTITSPEFLAGKPQLTFNNANMIIITEPIKSFQELMPIADFLGKEPTILLYDSLSMAALNSIYLNYETLGLIPISISAYLQSPNNVMEIFLESLLDIKVVDGVKTKLADFGMENVVKTSVNIFQDKMSIMTKVSDRARTIYENNKMQDDFKLEQAVINVGGSSPSERENNYLRVEDAVIAVTNALREGVCLSAGRAYQKLDELTGLKVFKEFTDLTSLITPTAEYESYKTIEQVVVNSFALLEQIMSIRYLLSNE